MAKGIRTINLEEGRPTSDEAMILLRSTLQLCKNCKTGILYVIHGYGSSGTGGVIRTKSRQWLMAQARKGVVKSVVFGEDFNVFSPKAVELKNKYRELGSLMYVCNDGVTIVEV